MKTVKLIALDLDGTIIREDQTISPEDRNAIARAQKAGVAVVIATGRIFPTAGHWIRKLNITTPVICCNGAEIREGGKTVLCSPIDKEQLQKAYWAMEKYDTQRYVFCGDHIYCIKGLYHEALFSKWNFGIEGSGLIVHCKDYNEISAKVGGGAVKLLVCTRDESRHSEMIREIKALSSFDIVMGEALNFELTPKGVNKGAALSTLAQSLGVELENTMAIGDSLNDFEMIRTAGLGVAMGNSMPELFKIADDVTLPIQKNGVAAAIGKHVFGEETDFSNRDLAVSGVY